MSLRAAVLGHPIGHSKSPALHRAAYARLGVDIAYTAIDVTAGQLPAFMEGVRAEDSWCGLSVTMPLKSAMIAEVDEVRGAGSYLGVINTVAFERGSAGIRRIGYNTDVEGIVEAVRYAGAVDKPRAVVLGGGGTSAAAIAALHELGAGHVEVFVRDTSRAVDAQATADALGISLTVLPIRDAVEAMATAELAISTLPPRAADGFAGELGGFPLHGAGMLLDVAYDPWPSRIAAAWTAGGGTVVPGLEMLLYQAVRQIRLFTGGDVTADVIDVMCDSVGLPRRVF